MTSKMFLSRVYPRSLLIIFFIDFVSSSYVFPEIGSYAKVSINRAQPFIVIDKNTTDQQSISQARNFQDITIDRSPVYVPSRKSAKLRNGEAIDHQSSKIYTTLDRDAVAQLDAAKSRKQQAQDRFHPPASFEHTLAHANAMRDKSQSSSASTDSKKTTFPVPSYATLPRDVYSTSYDYQPDSKPNNNDPPAGGNDDYSPESGDSFSKIPDSYAQPEIYSSDSMEDTPKFSGFPSSSSYEEKYPSKPVEFSDNYQRPSYGDVPYVSHDDYNHDLIYDHPPEDHYHDYAPTTTTEEPEMNDERLSKRPYSYYYIGRKLWYVPLYFSIYFIIYIAALVLKSITRHKINFPASLAAAAGDGRNAQKLYEGLGWYDLTKRVLDGIDLYNSIGKSKKRVLDGINLYNRIEKSKS